MAAKSSITYIPSHDVVTVTIQMPSYKSIIIVSESESEESEILFDNINRHHTHKKSI